MKSYLNEAHYIEDSANYTLDSLLAGAICQNIDQSPITYFSLYKVINFKLFSGKN